MQQSHCLHCTLDVCYENVLHKLVFNIDILTLTELHIMSVSFNNFRVNAHMVWWFQQALQGNHAMTAQCAQYVSALKIVSTKSADDCARISTSHSYHYSVGRWNYFWSIPSNVITAPSDLNVTHRQTDGHCGITAR